jgi:BirA family transcriptional regulator, biotin operon repressor / biotin---[acetyl-CoA-carboxylase] ligase
LKNPPATPFSEGLETRFLGRPLVFLESTRSTNDLLLRWASEGAPEGTAVWAERQTKGRGRHGRKWDSRPGKSLTFSVLLRPSLGMGDLPEITLAAAVAVAKALESYGLKPKIKWPNDLLLGGKKICGILTETGRPQDKRAPVVLGIGVNLNQRAEDFPRDLRPRATSFLLHAGRRVDRAEFFQRLLVQLEKAYLRVLARRFDLVLSDWRRRAAVLGRQVRVEGPRGFLYGQVLDVDAKGALMVRNDLGMVERVHSGTLEFLGNARGRSRP